MDGLERIKILGSEIKAKPMLKIIEYLLSRTDMNEKYLNEEKSLKQMITFIRSEAQKQAEDGAAMVENEEVYGWAIHYWDETNEKLGLTKERKVEKTKLVNEHNIEEKKDNEVSKKKKWVPEGQLTLFDFM